MDAALAAIGWSRLQLAAAIGHANRAKVDRWARDLDRIPGELAGWLRRTVAHFERNPPPQLPLRPYRQQ